ncbi:MAG TPA: winged helix-turn-helix domain-containing protein, partial [Anaerolineae bacterium]|nr:winged helix-turn-helix domain-containing protein [Anaerolineae bacterium]
YFLHDAGSSNGTFVNHHLIQAPYHLKHKDLIGLGEPTPTLRFMDPDPTFVPQSRLTYDKRSMAFYLNQTEIKLTPIQFRLMQHLYQNTGRVCTRESCAEAIWGREYDPGLDADALDRNISNLRRQLRQIDEETDLIETKRGIGYVLHLI